MSGRFLFLLFLAGFVVTVARAADEPFGSTSHFESKEGINETTNRYTSCAKTFQAAQAYGGLGSDATDVAPASEPLPLFFQDFPLKAQVYPGAGVDGLPLVQLPLQSFLVHTAHSLHKSVHGRAEFDGFYVLLKSPSDSPPLIAFLKPKFAVVELEATAADIPAGEYFLVPIEQYPTLHGILNDARNSIWTIPGTRNLVPSEPPRVTPGVLKTGRGTVYRFNENGSVDIFQRDGQIKHISAIPEGAVYLPYASHAAILRRQGVDTQERRPHVLTELAILHNGREIPKYQEENGITAAERGVYNFQMSSLAEAFAQNTKSDAVMEAIRIADRSQHLLPLYLRWRKLEEIDFLNAPVRTDGRRELRSIVPFLFVIDPAESSLYQGQFRLISPDAIHLQALHAQIGNLALAAEKHGWIKGGHLALEYDEGTGHIAKISLEGNGINSLSRPGEQIKLSQEELARLKQDLRYRIPFNLREKVILDIEEKKN